MLSFHQIGEMAFSLAETANNAHCEVQNIEAYALTEPKKALALYESVYNDLEYLREALAVLATDLGTSSPHDSRNR